MKELRFSVGEEAEGRRLDVFLMGAGDAFASRAEVQRLVRKGHVRIGGRPASSSHRVRCGEQVEVTVPPPEPSHLQPEDIPIKVAYEDDDLIVVDKPAGLVTHPGAGRRSGTLANALLFHCGRLSPSEDPLRPGIVHRLDKDASGLLVAAKTARAHARLALQFKNRTIRRLYRAVVWGVVEFDEGVVEAPIGRHPRHPKKMAVVKEGGKRAFTRYRVLRRFARATELEVRIRTGRTHQVRVHLAHLGCPIIGDAEYSRRDVLLNRLALHAVELGFKHPTTGEHMHFTSPLPAEMEDLLKRLGA